MHLAQEVARCRRMKTSLAVMVCDIDGLKKINDSFGHLEGDKLLREFSTRLKEACRGYDYVARMGGDEFVITAPGLTPEAALEKASRLNQAAIEAGRHTCGRDVITLSVGTAFCPENGYDVEALLAEADRRMYSIKQTHHAEAAAAHRPSGARGCGEINVDDEENCRACAGSGGDGPAGRIAFRNPGAARAGIRRG